MSCNNCNPNFPDDDASGCGNCNQRCHEVVATAAEVSGFRNAFVTVTSENATYHVDESGNIIAVNRSPLFIPNYVPQTGDYIQVTVYDFNHNAFYVFDPTGAYKTGVLS